MRIPTTFLDRFELHYEKLPSEDFWLTKFLANIRGGQARTYLVTEVEPPQSFHINIEPFILLARLHWLLVLAIFQKVDCMRLLRQQR